MNELCLQQALMHWAKIFYPAKYLKQICRLRLYDYLKYMATIMLTVEVDITLHWVRRLTWWWWSEAAAHAQGDDPSQRALPHDLHHLPVRRPDHRHIVHRYDFISGAQPSVQVSRSVRDDVTHRYLKSSHRKNYQMLHEIKCNNIIKIKNRFVFGKCIQIKNIFKLHH